MEKNYNFDYLIEKINNIDFEMVPFKHVYIENFFSDEHFQEIIQSKEIISPESPSNDKILIEELIKKGFEPISFPGCIVDIQEYIGWRENKKSASHHSACEGLGMALRLRNIQSPILKAINDFIVSDKFNRAIAEKFDVYFESCSIDGGIQKYLDGYEISPHPDTRRKATTFMVNINPSNESESLDHHTHYLNFKPEYGYVKSFWEGNGNIDRPWVPWGWAESVKQQNKNNSIVLFSPNNETLHAVKANYNHFVSQRTQLYGNLWYTNFSTSHKITWEDLDLQSCAKERHPNTQGKKIGVKRMIPQSIKKIIKRAIPKKAKK